MRKVRISGCRLGLSASGNNVLIEGKLEFEG
jgi:hypothetical protein